MAAMVVFPKSKVKSLLIIIFLVILPIGIGYRFYMNQRGETSIWIGVEYDNYHSRPIDLIEDLHLNESTAANFTDTTLTLMVRETISNRTLQYRYNIINHTAQLSHPYFGLRFDEPKPNSTHHFSFRYILNSTDPIIQNINILGSNNTINLSVTYTTWNDIKTSLDEGYSSFSRTVDILFGKGARIWVVDSPSRDTIKGHSFLVRLGGWVTD